MKFLTQSMVKLDVEAETPEEAIRAAGSLLVESGAADECYVQAMVDSYTEKGPYFVLAPQIALPHAKAENGVNEASVSLVRLKRPVAFGHSANDPVDLVFALGSSSNAEHIALLRRLTRMLNDPRNIEAIRNAKQYTDIENVIARSALQS